MPQEATLDDLIDDVYKINKKVNIRIPFPLHGFLNFVDQAGKMEQFELFLRTYRSTRIE